MLNPFSPRERIQSRGEEIANSISHGIGMLAALAAAPILIASAVHSGSASTVVGASVFAVCMVILFFASTIYHAMPRNRIKSRWQLVDRSAIFLLIAGSYTPFTLGVLRGPWGWSLLGIVWGLVLVGVILTLNGGTRFRRIKTALYLLMGWLVIVAIEPLMVNISIEGMFWLLLGGIAYTTGVAFYAAKQIHYSHFVWHLFVIAGAACHFIAVLFHAG